MEVTTYSRLEQLLSVEHHPDGWYDDLLDHAEELVSMLSPDEWERLESSMDRRPDYWQRQLADALPPHEGRGRRLLVRFLRSDHDRVAGVALSSLRASGWKPGDEDMDVIEGLRARLPAAYGDMVDDVVRRAPR